MIMNLVECKDTLTETDGSIAQVKKWQCPTKEFERMVFRPSILRLDVPTCGVSKFGYFILLGGLMSTNLQG